MSAGAPTVLQGILDSTRAEVERRKREVPPRVLEEQSARAPLAAGGSREGSFRVALERPGIGVIAEFKRRSPSAGRLREGAEVADTVRAYERGGAVAVSVLTEGPNFDGSLEDLRVAQQACELPILRKDFIVDPYQLHEARSAGAAAVLLIVAALAPGELAGLYDRARALGLDVLIEVHDRSELACALELGAELVGINNRDLRDFSVDLSRTSQLMSEIPPGVIVVSESGIAGPQQLSGLELQGVHAVLVGELLMRSTDPEGALRALRAQRSDTFNHAGRLL